MSTKWALAQPTYKMGPDEHNLLNGLSHLFFSPLPSRRPNRPPAPHFLPFPNAEPKRFQLAIATSPRQCSRWRNPSSPPWRSRRSSGVAPRPTALPPSRSASASQRPQPRPSLPPPFPPPAPPHSLPTTLPPPSGGSPNAQESPRPRPSLRLRRCPRVLPHRRRRRRLRLSRRWGSRLYWRYAAPTSSWWRWGRWKAGPTPGRLSASAPSRTASLRLRYGLHRFLPLRNRRYPSFCFDQNVQFMSYSRNLVFSWIPLCVCLRDFGDFRVS